MSYLSANIATRVRELVEDAVGDIRAIASTRFLGNLADGLTDTESIRRALPTGKPTRIRIAGPYPHPNKLTDSGSKQIHYVDAYVTVARGVHPGDQLDDDLADAIDAAFVVDGSAIQQAFSWPPNLSTTSAGGDTGIKGADWMGPTTTAPIQVKGEAGAAQLKEQTFRLRLTVVSSPATT